MAFIIRATEAMTDPLPDTPYLPPVAYMSDGFSGSDSITLIGRVSDSAMGGSPVTYVGLNDNNARTMGITSNVLGRTTSGSTGWVTGFAIAAADVEVSFDMVVGNVASSWWVNIRATSATSTAASARTRQQLKSL